MLIWFIFVQLELFVLGISKNVLMRPFNFEGDGLHLIFITNETQPFWGATHLSTTKYIMVKL